MATESTSTFSIGISPEFQSKLSAKKFSEKDVSKEIHRLAVEHMKSICLQASERKETFSDCSSETKLQYLNKGIFYPNEYADLLEECGQSARYDFFKKKGIFFHGYLDKKAFKQPKDEESLSKKAFMHFQAKPEIPASKALDAAINGPSLLGCGEVCQLSYYAALRTLWGEEKFNQVFHKEAPLTIAHDCLENPLYQYTKTISPVRKDAYHSFIPGTMVYTNGIPNYQGVPPYMLRHPAGNASAYNTIQDQEGKCLGFGLSNEGLTHDELQKYLYDEFKKESDLSRLRHLNVNVATALTQRHLPPELFQEIDQLAQQSFARFKRSGGGSIPLVIQFNGEKVKNVLKD